MLREPDSNLRVLQFAPRVCWPLDTGAKLRNYHLARTLAQRAKVSLLAFTDQQSTANDLDQVYEQVITVTRDLAYTLAKVLSGALGKTPLPILNYTTEPMKTALEKVLAEQDFDIIQIESIHLVAYLETIRRAGSGKTRRPLVICDWHNIESELMRRYSERAGRIRQAYAARTARLISEFEIRALQQFDAQVVVSARDGDYLRRLNSKARILVIENGVDTDFYAALENEKNLVRRRLVFVGSMDYHANIDGVVSFARRIWPELRERRPELIFTIVGKDPSPEVRELAQVSGIEVTGTVDDVRPFYREAIAAVVPLNIGGGSRLKILEAMAAGVPVVSTTLGAEGLDVEHNENILIADSDEDLSAEIMSVVTDEGRRNRLSAAGRALVKVRYDWAQLGATLFSRYEELLMQPSQ